MSTPLISRIYDSSLSTFSNKDVIRESSSEFSNMHRVAGIPPSTAVALPASAPDRIFASQATPNMNSMPPEITSTLTKDKALIKPIAFRPLLKKMNVESQRYGSTPVLTKSSFHIHHYGSSHDLRRQTNRPFNLAERKLRSASPTAMSSLPFFNHHARRNDYDDLDSVRLRKISPSSVKESDIYAKSFRSLDRAGTIEDSNSFTDLGSSSSDSTSFADQEVTLREKDSELSYLRQTMEHNEQVIFKVYKEKELAYEREMRKLKVLYESKMRAASQKSIKLEQMLTLRSYQFQEEQKRLKDEKVKAVGEISVLREEIDSLRARLEETEWKLCQKTGELTHLKSELNLTQDDQRNYCQEISGLKNRINQLKSSLISKDAEIDLMREKIAKTDVNERSTHTEVFSLLGQLENEVTNEEPNVNKTECEKIDKSGRENIINLIDKIKKKISCVIRKWHDERTSWDNEKTTWIAEKEKVLRYQKRLQLNYIEMFRRNKSLESEIENLSLELHLNSRPHREELLEKLPSSKRSSNEII